MRSHQPAIACERLTKRFGERTAVDSVTFEVRAGTITGFVGANGAGKTTTLRMILGLVTPTAGSATVFGRPYHDLEAPRRTVGAALDGPGMHPAVPARKALATIATSAGVPPGRVAEVLEVVELAGDGGRRVGTFSLGMRQRLALAAALLGDPPVLILDEPVNGLDPAGILWMRSLLRRLADEGRAVLVSSHLLAELAQIADRVLIIEQGRLLADTTLEDLLAGQRPRVELECADPSAAADALRARADRVEVLDGGRILVDGLTARAVGELVAQAGAGPVFGLSERSDRFEDVYFELAGSDGVRS